MKETLKLFEAEKFISPPFCAQFNLQYSLYLICRIHARRKSDEVLHMLPKEKQKDPLVPGECYCTRGIEQPVFDTLLALV